MTAAQNFTVTLRMRQGGVMNVSGFASDVVAAPCTFSMNGLAAATDLPYFRVPSDCWLVAVSINTGLTATVALTPTRDGAIVSGQVIDVVANDNTNAGNRPSYAIPIRGGTLVGLTQS